WALHVAWRMSWKEEFSVLPTAYVSMPNCSMREPTGNSMTTEARHITDYVKTFVYLLSSNPLGQEKLDSGQRSASNGLLIRDCTQAHIRLSWQPHEQGGSATWQTSARQVQTLQPG